MMANYITVAEADNSGGQKFIYVNRFAPSHLVISCYLFFRLMTFLLLFYIYIQRK